MSGQQIPYKTPSAYLDVKLRHTRDGHSELFLYVTSAERKSLNVRVGDQPILVYEIDTNLWIYWDSDEWVYFGSGGGGASPAKIEKDISAASFEYVDIVPLASFYAVEYLIGVWSPTKTNKRRLSVTRSGSSTMQSVHGITGDYVLHAIEVEISGSDMRLKVTNNEAVTIHFEAVKTTLE